MADAALWEVDGKSFRRHESISGERWITLFPVGETIRQEGGAGRAGGTAKSA
jgi:hypothetical protein